MSTTTSLLIKHITQSQKQKEVTANEGLNILDQAIAKVSTHQLIQNLGVTTQEASTWTAGATDRKVVQKITVTDDGLLTSIVVSFDSSGTGDAKGILYAINGLGEPDAFIDSTAAVTNPSAGWNTFTFASPVSVTPGDYLVGIIADFDFVLDRSASGEEVWWDDDTYSDGAADPWGTLNFQAIRLSIYAIFSLLVSNVWTMSASQMRDGMHIIEGALTANVEVVVPDRTKLYCVFNNTSGAFTLDVKTASGNGTRITQGSTVWLYCDGSDVEPITNTGGTKNP